MFNPLTSLSIPFGHFFLFGMCLFSLLIHCFQNCFFCITFHAFIPHILLSNIPTHCLVCIFFLIPPGFYLTSPPSSSHTPPHMPLKYHTWNVPTNLAIQRQLIWILRQIASRSSHLLANLSFFYQHVSFSLLHLFSSYIYLLPLMHFETT